MPNKTKIFTIISKTKLDPFTAKNGKQYTKHRYQTDSDVLEIFPDWLEVNKKYEFEEVDKEVNGRHYLNWELIREFRPEDVSFIEKDIPVID